MSEINKKEVLESIIRSGFAVIPYAGQALTEICFDYRGRIKQNRLNRFTELLCEYFLENPNINIENIRNEDFSDIFESVIKRVVLTKSEEKLKRFKDILVNKIENPSLDTDNIELYLDLVSNLTEIEIKVLYYHSFFDKNYKKQSEILKSLESDLITKEDKIEEEKENQKNGYANNLKLILSEYQLLKQKIAELKPFIEDKERFRNCQFYNISDDEFLYCKQSLYSKALLVDSGIGGIGVRPFQIMSITQFGLKFIGFLKDNP